jgi:hypothetical protein
VKIAMILISYGIMNRARAYNGKRTYRVRDNDIIRSPVPLYTYMSVLFFFSVLFRGPAKPQMREFTPRSRDLRDLPGSCCCKPRCFDPLRHWLALESRSPLQIRIFILRIRDFVVFRSILEGLLPRFTVKSLLR